MPVIEIDVIGEEALQQTLNRLGAQGMALVKKAEETRLKEAVTWARANRLSGRPGLIPRSGDLRNAFWYEVRQVGETIMARLGFIRGPSGEGDRQTNPLKYAWTHEFGKIIRPVSGQYLRVPTQAVLTPAGRYKAQYNVISARDLPNTFIQRVGGRLGIYEIHRGAPPVKLFSLVRQVEVPARPTLRPTWFIFKPLLVGDIRQGLGRLSGGGRRGG